MLLKYFDEILITKVPFLLPDCPKMSPYVLLQSLNVVLRLNMRGTSHSRKQLLVEPKQAFAYKIAL
jgi:hypothetical protein